MRAAKLTALISLCGYLLIAGPFSAHLKNRPVQIKLGYIPEAPVLKYLSADQRYLVADWTILKAVLYFGELMEKARGRNMYASEPDYPGMFKVLQTGLRIDPYNADAYYFAQAVYTWDVGRYREVNNLLDYGMRHRTWDSQLPFFAGFNAAYFLKDYQAGALYLKRAAEIANEQQFATLAAKYFHQAGEDDLAVMFLDVMQKTARDENEKMLYANRRNALVAAREIQRGVDAYRLRYGQPPERLDLLVSRGFLKVVPEDPYGGQFYLDEKGRVQTTSKFSFAGARNSRNIRR